MAPIKRKYWHSSNPTSSPSGPPAAKTSPQPSMKYSLSGQASFIQKILPRCHLLIHKYSLSKFSTDFFLSLHKIVLSLQLIFLGSPPDVVLLNFTFFTKIICPLSFPPRNLSFSLLCFSLATASHLCHKSRKCPKYL
jgi:hypothetical protein